MDRASGFKGKGNRPKIVTQQNDIGDIAGDVGGRGGEGDPDIGDFQRRRIVNAIADHRDALAGTLQVGDDLQFLRWRQPREDAGASQRCS